MSGLQFTYRFTGPVDQGILLKNRGNNAIVNAKMGMPQKFYPSSNDSMFSNARQTYIQDAGGGTLLSGHYDSSQQIYMKKMNAIGKSSTLKSTVSFQGKSNDTTVINRSLARVRGGGSVAPKKKGALANPFKSGGGSSITGSGNRQIIA
jgi:hypothetical protein